MKDFDLLTTVEQGGCSAKLSPKELGELLSGIPLLSDNNVMVDITTHDDAGVYRLNDETALIVTTDFFPPVCSDARDFGEIAAANALSDVYAMGGKPLLALNITMFPSQKIPLAILKEILLGGTEKVAEAGAIVMGGHTIDDYPPKYGLAVVGTVAPEKLITNAGLREGDIMILTKPLGTGIMIAAKRVGMASDEGYRKTLENMKLLNRDGCELMQRYGVKGATDITGFGLAGHCMKMAAASGVTVELDSASLPTLPNVLELIDDGCVGGATFRNLEYVKESVLFENSCLPERKLLACDPQTSGGLLFGLPGKHLDEFTNEIKNNPLYKDFTVIGRVSDKKNYDCVIK